MCCRWCCRGPPRCVYWRDAQFAGAALVQRGQPHEGGVGLSDALAPRSRAPRTQGTSSWSATSRRLAIFLPLHIKCTVRLTGPRCVAF